MLHERSWAIEVARLGLVEKAETFRAGAASHPSTPAASDDGSQPAAPRARRAMRLRRYQQPVRLKTRFVQRVRRVARREGSRRRAGPASWARWGCSESARAPVGHGDRAAAERLRRDKLEPSRAGQP